MRKTTSLNLILVVVLQLFSSSLEAKTSKALRYVNDEIIICYSEIDPTTIPNTANIATRTNLSSEEDFIDEMVNSYRLQARPQANLKLQVKQHSRFKKARKLKKHKLKKQIAVVKLDKKLDSSNLHKLIQKLNKEKFQNQNYKIEAVYQIGRAHV
mgnify:CR=1 FL=1